MNENEHQLPTEARTALRNCFAQIRLARATELAQSGRLLEAEAVLTHNGELPDNPHELDLLARIAVQQSQYSRAEELWKKALAKAPDREEFQKGLNALEALQIQKQLQRDFVRGVLFFLLLGAATALAVLMSSSFR